jgi:hypothetical protein
MKIFNNKIPPIALALSTAALMSYLLPGDYIIEKVCQHTRTVKGIYVKQKVILYLPRIEGYQPASKTEGDTEGKAAKITLPDYEPPPDGMSPEILINPESEEHKYCKWIRDSELIIQAPDMIRLRIYGPGVLEPPECPCKPPPAHNQELLKIGPNTVIITKDSIEPLKDQGKWFFVNFMIAIKANDLKKKMQEFKVNLESVRLVLIEEKVAYMVGDDDEKASRVWLDKDAFLPMKLYISGSQEPKPPAIRVDLMDYRYLGQQGVWYPANIDFFEDDAKKETFDMIKTIVNPRLERGAFDADKIKASLKQKDSSQNQ